MKDVFSAQAKLYAQFRPTYPQELIEYIVSLVAERNTAWDCGTGSGQVAVALAEYFHKVVATDISAKQIGNAIRKENIFYSVEAAEGNSFRDGTFDLITVAQAIHWFDFEKFYSEVKRTLKPNGIIAVIGYALVRADEQTNAVIDNFYSNILGAYWDAERKYIDELYQTIPFPFDEIKAPQFSNTYEWNIEQMRGYLHTWSAVQHYISRNNENPVAMIENELQNCWKNGEVKQMTFPLLLRIGKNK